MSDVAPPPRPRRMRRWLQGWIGDAPARSFDDYARTLTLRHGELLLISFLGAVAAGACLDPLAASTTVAPRVLPTLAWRAIVAAVSVAGLVAARALRRRRARVHAAVATYAITASALVGAWLGDSGGADPAWFLGACAVPLAILPLVVPLRVRALLTAAVALALAAGYVAVQPAMLGEPGVLGPMLTLVTVGATGVLLGEHYYRLVRSHHRQRVHMQALIADGTRRLRQLLTEVERAEQAERRRIGRELHDELAQVLTALKLEVELATYKVEPGTATAASLGRIDALSDQLVEAKQRLVHALRPATLDELGFGRAVERHVADVTARSGLTIELDRAAGVELPEPAATTIYRGLQEALTNTIRHACATTARIRIAVDDGAYLLEVRDDGIGFDPDAVGAGHFGLLGLRERAAILGGTVAVVSAPGRGTQVTVRLPADATPPA